MVYEAAREAIQRKMQLFGETQAAARLPAARPYSLEQLLDQDWLPPKAREGLSHRIDGSMLRPNMPGRREQEVWS